MKSRPRIFLSPPHLSGEEIKFVREAFESNYIAPLGPQVDAFEREFSARVGLPHALAVSSGTAAMHLALRVLGIGPGDEVLAPSLTFIGGVSPVLFLGAKPVFIDSEPVSWNIDPDLVAEELRVRAGKGRPPRAVIAADIYGQCADLDRVLAACAPYGIPLISDAAESMGAAYKGRHAGVGARAAVYSFNGNKIMTTSGGGMLASDDESLVVKARFLSQQARDPAPHYEHSEIGYNYRLSNILAAVGRGQLLDLGARVKAHRRIFERYRGRLGELPGIEFMPEAPWGTSNRWLTVILIEPQSFGADRDEVRLALEAENIESRPLWKPMHLQPVFRGCRARGGKCCEDLFRRGLCLPSGTAMTDDDVERTAAVIKAARRQG